MAGCNADRTGPHHWLFRLLLAVQGFYYLATGVWPLVSIETFQQVTGRKTDHMVTGRESDHWLVLTVGVLVTAIAIALLAAWWRKSEPIKIAILAVASAVALTAIDVIYVWRGVIAPIYLVDALLEILFVLVWTITLVMKYLKKSNDVDT